MRNFLFLASRGKIKLARRVSAFFWTLWNRVYLYGYASIGRQTSFEGPVIVESCGGHISIGENCRIGRNVQLSCSTGALLEICDNVTLNVNTQIVARKNIVIGKYCLIGEGCSIRDNDHAFSNLTLPIRQQGYISSPVIIGNDVWMGRHAVVGKGVTIGNGCVIGASSVVTRSFESNSVVAGIPASLLKRRE